MISFQRKVYLINVDHHIVKYENIIFHEKGKKKKKTQQTLIMDGLFRKFNFQKLTY